MMAFDLTVKRDCFVAERGFIAVDSPRMRRRHIRGSQVGLKSCLKGKETVQFLKEKIKFNRRGPRCSKFSEFGHFTFAFLKQMAKKYWRCRPKKDANHALRKLKQATPPPPQKKNNFNNNKNNNDDNNNNNNNNNNN